MRYTALYMSSIVVMKVLIKRAFIYGKELAHTKKALNNNKYKIEDTAAKLAADNATNEDQCCLFNLVYKIYVAQY